MAPLFGAVCTMHIGDGFNARLIYARHMHLHTFPRVTFAFVRRISCRRRRSFSFFAVAPSLHSCLLNRLPLSCYCALLRSMVLLAIYVRHHDCMSCMASVKLWKCFSIFFLNFSLAPTHQLQPFNEPADVMVGPTEKYTNFESMRIPAGQFFSMHWTSSAWSIYHVVIALASVWQPQQRHSLRADGYFAANMNTITLTKPSCLCDSGSGATQRSTRQIKSEQSHRRSFSQKKKKTRKKRANTARCSNKPPVCR